jgi:hypothetical protein
MNLLKEINYKLTSVGKFYFLDYFYILLKSVTTVPDGNRDDIFDHFRTLKDSHQLGESKYKKISLFEELSGKQLGRYRYTFNQIIEESRLYELIINTDNHKIILTKLGSELLELYDKDRSLFNSRLFALTEGKLYGFHYLVSKSYEADLQKGGLLIFPIYSPLKLGFIKNQITTSADVIKYIKALSLKLKEDINKFLKTDIDINEGEAQLISKLKDSKLIDDDYSKKFDQLNYNLITKRVRDFWLNYFLKTIYKINLSVSYFDLWIHRGKQLGIINTTEFYPDFDGKIVYPISILSTKMVNNADFSSIYKYPNNEILFLHKPNLDTSMDEYIRILYDSYLDLRNRYKSLFINLADLRDIVCYKWKISSDTFIEFLQKAYLLNLQNEIRINISLEADKLPEETQAVYLKREPILIDNKLRNIISINLKTHG